MSSTYDREDPTRGVSRRSAIDDWGHSARDMRSHTRYDSLDDYVHQYDRHQQGNRFDAFEKNPHIGERDGGHWPRASRDLEAERRRGSGHPWDDDRRRSAASAYAAGGPAGDGWRGRDREFAKWQDEVDRRRSGFVPPPSRVAHDVIPRGRFGEPPPNVYSGRPESPRAPARRPSLAYDQPPPPPAPSAHSHPSRLHQDVAEYTSSLLMRRFIDCFEQFYSDDVVMSDNGLHDRIGKRECRQWRTRFLDSVVTWHDVRVRNTICDGDRSVIEVLYDVTFRSGRRVIQKQALVQKWRAGQIIHETSYHTV